VIEVTRNRVAAIQYAAIKESVCDLPVNRARETGSLSGQRGSKVFGGLGIAQRRAEPTKRSGVMESAAIPGRVAPSHVMRAGGRRGGQPSPNR